MQLLKVHMKNWQTFSDVNLDCKDFLIFTGASSTGKSSFMKALLYFFQVRNLHNGDIRDEEKILEITGTFKDENNNFFQLKILKNINEKTRYFKKTDFSKRKENKNWEEIDEKEYKKYVYQMSLFFIPSIMGMKQLNYLFKKLLEKKELQKYQRYYKIFQNSSHRKMSLGYYRHIFITLLQEIAEKEKNSKFWKNTILLWEEPEFFLNPQQERACYEALLQNTKLGLMAIVSTNSSRFIEIGNYQSLCLFRRVKQEIEIYQYNGNLFSGDEVTVFNMNYWINPDRSELFFARKVILVEGQTDKIVLSYLAKNLGVHRYDYSVIECGSKSSIPQFIRLLNTFHIPYVVVYDKDNHYWRTETELENSTLKNKIIQKMVNKKIGDYVEFENDIEEEIYDESRDKKNYKNKPFYALETVINPKYQIPKKLEDKVRKIFK